MYYKRMAIKTSNFYGKLNITDNAIAMTAYYAAIDCYGVVDLVSRTLTDTISELFNRFHVGKGVKVTTINNKINIELFVVLKGGVN
ncbi:MAG: Asp23/Gls24 family envelope stress response protein, partial [Clostridia bacterium]